MNDQCLLSSAEAQDVLAFDNITLKEPSYESIGEIELEAPFIREMPSPHFVIDLSDKSHNLILPKQQTIHGTYLVSRKDVMLFGPNNVVSRDGSWTCESRANRGVHLAYMQMPFFGKLFPGDAPALIDIHTAPKIATAGLADRNSVLQIDEPIFLGTTLEPPVWGRWIASVIPRAIHYLRYGGGRKFLCHVDRPWERKTLNMLGIDDSLILPHEPGKTYLCHDLMMAEGTGQSLSLSLLERDIYNDISNINYSKSNFGRKLFVSRVSTTKKNPNYRPLTNENEVIEFVSEKGFSIIEPELYPLNEQISAFREADIIIFIGGSAIYNAAFCRPGTRVITIESSNTFAPTHLQYMAALELEFGIVYGQEDPEDLRPHHRRWSVDIAAAWSRIEDVWPDVGQ